ncbi:MaoC/PaaZ C-terminal domain-containing protein [Bradyrhizobium sp. 190]|uniref:MaoC/PaaZ C-terminal domain-containing protein n=1 Tax=Bradyrhizobium sp. 190 TaxID=2782658 RepID=UPI001FFB103D|nr:MaoC/PaaZ C-terminal domain-containing protein [Bradyrhizobium sp. 190]
MIIATKPESWRLPSFSKFEIGRMHAVTRTFTETEVDTFGYLSGDLNPLHMDDEFASRSPFGRRVVHGLLTAAVVSRTYTELTGPGSPMSDKNCVPEAGFHRRQDHGQGHYRRQEGNQADSDPGYDGPQTDGRGSPQRTFGLQVSAFPIGPSFLQQKFARRRILKEDGAGILPRPML